MKAQKGQFWRRNHECIWVRFVFGIEDDTVHFLEYQPNGVVPYRGSEKMYEEDEDYPSWVQISAPEAELLIVNMKDQDTEYSYRLGKKADAEKLAQALKILERKKVSSVCIRDNVVRISTDNGAEYEIALTRDGYSSRQTGLPDPW
jgi:hypothetical protein